MFTSFFFTFKPWQPDPSEANQSSYVTNAKSVLQLTKHSVSKKKCDELATSNSEGSCWSCATNVFNNVYQSLFPLLRHKKRIISLATYFLLLI